MNKTVEEGIRKIVKQEIESYFGGEPGDGGEQGLQTRGQRRNQKNEGKGDVKNPRIDRRLKGNRGRAQAGAEE